MIPSKDQLLPYINNIKEAAMTFGKSEKTIRRWMQTHEIYVVKDGYRPNKLSNIIARKIRHLDNMGCYTQTQLAVMFGVSQATIGRIVNGIYYKQVGSVIGGEASVEFKIKEDYGTNQ